MKTVYLDNAATTRMRPDVLEVITQSMEELYANPSSSYAIGRQSKAAIEAARKQIAQSLGVEAAEIVFTSGGTEANNLILQTAIKDIGVTHIITSKIEHHAVLKTVEVLSIQYGIKVSYVPILPDGELCLETLANLLASSKEKVMVSLLHSNNEIGTILNLEKVGKLCLEHNALFHSDTVQSIGHLNLHVNNVHFATASAHKFYGPKGVGFAIVRKNLGAKALINGGEQERGLRAGTEAIHQILGMAAALKLCYDNLEEERAYVYKIKTYAIDSLKRGINEISFNANSDDDSRKYNLINVCLPVTNEKANTLLFQLDMAGICCSRGSACQSGSNKPSHVLAEFLTPNKLAQTSLRFSFSIYNTIEDIDYMVSTLKDVLAKYT